MTKSGRAVKGSQKWIQVAVNNNSPLITPEALGRVEWVSPLASNDYEEYRDDALEHIEQGHLAGKLSKFWPRNGPQWDALGLAGPNEPVLVEAKSHVQELKSNRRAEAESSLQMIDDAFSRVKSDLGIQSRSDWSKKHYQYANRIAYLWFLRDQGVEAHLVFVCFLESVEQHQWQSKRKEIHDYLNLPDQHKLSGAIHHVYPRVSDLT